MVAAPGGVAAPVPLCRPKVYGRLFVQVTVKLPLLPLATAPCNDVYAKSIAVTADSEQVEVSVMLTLNWPDVFAASLVATPKAPATMRLAISFFIACSLL